jgi:uncharacterized protein YndB with AHSA1/START domain
VPESIKKEIVILAPVSKVWEALTSPDIVRQWMGEPEMKLEIETSWEVGQPMTIRGFHHVKFENKGRVLNFKPERTLKYDYLSSVSRLPDVPENYTAIEFKLTAVSDGTLLEVNLNGFPTETILKHVEFYWQGTLGILKNLCETKDQDSLSLKSS